MMLHINKERGVAIELSLLKDESADDCFADYGFFGFDIVFRLIVTIHLIGLAIRDTHIAFCLLNFQIVYFWRH